jgi:arylsulfatase A-like enzyme
MLAALPIVATAGLASALWLDSRQLPVSGAKWKGKLGVPVSVQLWGSLMLLWVVTFPTIRLDRSASRRALNLDVLGSRLNPPMAMLVSAHAALLDEPIEACLDVSELEPIMAEFSAPIVQPAGARRPPSVILLAVESLRHDVVHRSRDGVEVMPNLNALARGGLHLSRAYAQSTHSDYSDVCIGSSLYPLRTRGHHYYRADDPWPKKAIWDVLKPNGYATAIVSSQNEAWGGMDQFLSGPNLDLFYDARSSVETTHTSDLDTGFADEIRSGGLRAGKLDDAQTTDVAMSWVSKRAGRDEPFCLRINYQNAHFPYEIAAGAARPFQPCAIDFPASFLGYPEDKVEIVRNAYYNALHESDRQVGRLVDALRRLGRLDDTVFVVYGENGEAFHENGAVCHAGIPVEPAIRVACVIHAPALLRPRVEDYPFELIDIAPTVLGLMGRPPHPNFQGTDILAEDRVPVDERLLFFHAENAIARADAVLLAGRWKFHHDRAGGRTALYDVVADPGESRNLSDEQPELTARLRDTLARWRGRQLAYYHYAHYYKAYHPPRPPRWLEARRAQPSL